MESLIHEKEEIVEKSFKAKKKKSNKRKFNELMENIFKEREHCR